MSYTLKFAKASIEDNIQDFKERLGENSLWFYRVLESVKENFISRGVKVTDVLIRENQPIFVAVVKSYLPLRDEKRFPREGGVFVPGRSDLISFLNAILRDTEKEAKMELDRFERTGNIDFSIYVYGCGIYRINFSEFEHGYSMSVRFLNFEIPKIDDLRYPTFYKDFLNRFITDVAIKFEGEEKPVLSRTVNSGGLILHIGATGSGKTTSIASEIYYLANEISGMIATYENPIEYRFIGTKAPVKQHEIGAHIRGEREGLDFVEVRKNLLRNNPSVVMIGEVRTNEEIRSIVELGTRGHLVFSTMHAQNVEEALTILSYIMKDEPFLLASSLSGIVAHKLITTKDGQVLPLYEIFIPSDIEKIKIQKQDIASIKRDFYKEKKVKWGQTFSQSLVKYVEDGILTPSEAEHIKKQNFSLFAEEAKI